MLYRLCTHQTNVCIIPIIMSSIAIFYKLVWLFWIAFKKFNLYSNYANYSSFKSVYMPLACETMKHEKYKKAKTGLGLRRKLNINIRMKYIWVRQFSVKDSEGKRRAERTDPVHNEMDLNGGAGAAQSHNASAHRVGIPAGQALTWKSITTISDSNTIPQSAALVLQLAMFVNYNSLYYYIV